MALGLSLCGLTGYLLYLLLRKDDDDEDYSENFDRASKFKILEIAVPKDMVKVVIGRGGKNIKLIQEQSNTRINFKEREGEKPLCVIRGSIEACNIAENLLQEFIKTQPKLESEEMIVPQKCISRVIGRNGDSIREISAVSGAKIDVDNDRSSPMRIIKVTGKWTLYFIQFSNDQSM